MMTEEILLLDDDLTTLVVLEEALGRAGYNCSLCSDPQQALGIVPERPDIAVVVSDLYMPHMNGLEFADALSKLDLGRRPTPRILLLTARPSLESAVGALRTGAYDFLVKPVTQEQIVEAVKRALERARQDRLAAAQAAPDVEKLLAQTEKFAEELRRVAHGGAAPVSRPAPEPDPANPAATPPGRPSVSVLDTIEHLRRLRSRYEDHKLDDVGWELLLELLRAEQHEQRLSVSALTISIPGVSATTSLRRIGELAGRGYVDRVPDEHDGRRDFVSLTDKSRVLLKDYLEHVDSFLTQLRSNNSKQLGSGARPGG